MFSAHVETEIRRVAEARGIEPAALLAVVEVESGGKALTEVGGRPMPLILFEYHVFHRRLRPEARPGAQRSGLAAARWGEIAYPATQRERYALLARAALIDREAAHAACSWGVGQVLGENARWLGYESAEALAAEAISGVEGQVRLMLRFIAKRGLEPALAARDWTAFARGYNGPMHAKHDYAGRMARAHARWAQARPAPPAPAPIGVGARGEAVLRVQQALVALGVRLALDGEFGAMTGAAVRAFQTRQGLVRDGIVGPETLARLESALNDPAAA
ncbi:MAG: N-acetylmuramidase domain-containing protein [Rubrimonas sp.]|uniref:N-acetylmuramidase domain-containing protein n=1 Tax=Rubrimonas sp. TaxID=2036015 RepID=UPI002FDED9FD